MQFRKDKNTSNRKSLKEHLFGRWFNAHKNLKIIKPASFDSGRQNTKTWSFHKKKSFKVGATAFVSISIIAITVFSLLIPQNGKLFAANGSWNYGGGANGTGDANIDTSGGDVKLNSSGAKKLVTVNTADALASGYTVKAEEDLESLRAAGDVQNDLDDVRIKATNRGTAVEAELDRDIVKGQGAIFNGTSQAVTLASQISYADTANFTVELWYRGTDTAQNGDWGKSLLGRDNTDLFANLTLRSGYVEFLHYTTAWQHNIKSTTMVADGNWHHIAYINNSNETGSLYIDGTREINNLSSSNGNDANPYRIDGFMKGYNLAYTSGQIDEVRVSNNVRYSTASFVPQTTPFTPDSSTRGLWHLDSDAGDSSGNGNNGTLVASPYYSEGKVIAKNSAGSGMGRELASTDSGLLGNWHLNESPASNGTAIVSSTGSNNGTLNTDNGSNNKATTGKLSSAINFDGTGDYISLPGGGPISSGNFTIEQWVKPTAIGSVMCAYEQGSNGYIQTCISAAGKFAISVDGANIDAGSTTLVAGAWYHLALTYSGTAVTLYVNGVQDGSATRTANYTRDRAQIGSNVNSGGTAIQLFNGLIDEVGIYSRALSKSEIQEHYNAKNEVWFKTQSAIDASSTSEATGSHSYYMYYGDPAATNPPENKSNVYQYYEGFESYTNGQSLAGVNGWSVTQGTITASNSFNNSGSNSGKWLRSSGSTSAVGAFWDFGARSTDFVIEYNYRYSQRGSVFGTVGDTSPAWGSSVLYSYPTNTLARMNAACASTTISTAFTSANWYKFSEVHHPGSNTWDMSIKNGINYSASNMAYCQNENPRYFKMVTDSASAFVHETYVDDIIVRLSTANGPTITLGNEETLGFVTPGVWTSDAITATGLYGNWGELAFTETKPAGTAISYKVYQSDGNTLIPDGNLAGNSSGFTSSPVDLSTVSTSTYETIILKATLSCTTCTNTPEVDTMTVSYSYDTTAPSVPTGLTIGSVTNNTIPLTWDASTDAESGIAGYEVQRAPDSAGVPGTWANVASGPCSGVVATNSCSDTTVLPNTKYHYKVRAKDNENNYSAYSGFNGYQFKKDITFDTTAQGANVSGNVGGGTTTTGFPVAVHVNASSWPNATERSNFFNDTYNPNGKRVNFYDSDGTTRLAYEVEYYSTGSQEAIYWVGVPQVDGNSATDKIIVGYGNDPSGSDQDQPTSVWDSNFKAIYHLGDNNWGTSPEAKDSTSNAINGTNSGTASGTGKVRQGRVFGGVTDDDSINLTDIASLEGIGSLTTSYWVKSNSYNSFMQYLGKTDGTTHNKSIGSGHYDANDYFVRMGTGAADAYGYTTNNAWGTGAWRYASVVFDGSLTGNENRLKLYRDGQLETLATSGTIPATTPSGNGNLYIGRYVEGASNYYPDGEMDEVRISTISRSADWTKLEYYSMAKTNYNGDNGAGTSKLITNGSQVSTAASATTLPEVPVLTAFTSPTTDSTPQIVGTTDVDLANLTIRLYDNGVLAATTTANGSGAYTFANGDYSTPFTEGAHTNITARSVNAESAESADSNALSITFDLQAPTTSLTSNPVAADGANGYFKTIPSITLTISDPAFSAGNGTTYYKWDDGTFTSPSTYSTPIDMDLSIGQGTHTLYWKTTDTAGNVEASLNSQQFKLDSAMPNTLSISISGGSTYETLNPVTLTLSASDATSGMNEMQFSNDGVTFSSWEPYGTSPQDPWDLTDVTYGGTTDEGVKTVYVQFKDNAGNVTNPISDSITLDTVAPTNPSSPATGEASPSDPTVLTTNNWYNYTTPKFTLSGATDATAGVSGYYVYWGNSSTGSPTVDGAFQAGNTYTPTITTDNSGKTYYLRVRSKDNAGNIYTNADASTYTLFTYKFDVTNPNPVDYISPTPAGWSATDSFDFTWPVATDVLANSASSGVQGYQYKKQPDSEWTLSNDNTLTGITSYQTGVNVLQVRTIDNAGNTSSTIPVNYYFSGNVDAPTGLAADISQSEAQTVNNYKFTWDAAAGAQGYYYSVNALPSLNNTTFVNTNSTAYGPFATNQGLNTFYVVTKDENGNTGWSNYASVTFSCDTAAPGVPLNVTITDASNRTAENWALSLTWDEPAVITDDFNGYIVERSTDGNNFSEVATVGSSSKIYSESGLTNTTEYTYRVKSKDNTGNTSIDSTEVSKTPTGRYTEPPAIIGSPSFNVKTTKADISFVTDREADSFVQVGTTSQYGMTQGQLDSVKTHKVALSGLTPGTTYHFRAMWRDSDGNIGYSNDQIFKTTDAAAISEVKVSDITLDSAVISWETNTVSTSTVKYGETSAYGSEINDESGSSTTIHTIKISELKDGTTYNFKIGGSDTEGSAISSDNYAFTTLPKPRLTNIAYEQVKESAIPTLKINWESNVPVSSTVNVFENGRGIPREVAKALLETKHALTMTNLKDNTSYTMIVKGRDAYGNEATSDTISFKTALDSRPPVISNITVESSLLGFGVDAKGQLVVSWETDEMTTSQVVYGVGSSGTDYAYRTQEDTSITTQHVVIISDLKPSTSYHFSVVSKDQSGNTTKSSDQPILTEQATESVVDVVVKSLQNSIGWIFGAVFGASY